MAKKTGLGRGLDALFADAAPINEEDVKVSKPAKKAPAKSPAKSASKKTEPVSNEDRVLYIDINDIKPNKAQPRMTFDEDKLKELESSIKEHGVIQPLIVREAENGFELVAGERRWRASRLAGLKKVPCIIRDFDDKQNAIVAIIENMQREDLNPLEEARGYRTLMTDFGLTQDEAAQSVGRSRPAVANALRLLNLCASVQQMVESGRLSAGHGRAIAAIKNEAQQLAVAALLPAGDDRRRDGEDEVGEPEGGVPVLRRTGEDLPRRTPAAVGPRRQPRRMDVPDLRAGERERRRAVPFLRLCPERRRG